MRVARPLTAEAERRVSEDPCWVVGETATACLTMRRLTRASPVAVVSARYDF